MKRPTIAITKEANDKLAEVAPDGYYMDTSKELNEDYVTVEIYPECVLGLILAAELEGLEIRTIGKYLDMTEPISVLTDQYKEDMMSNF